jgi:predicted ATPase
MCRSCGNGVGKLFVKSVVIYNGNFPNRDRYPFRLRVFQETDRLEFSSRIVFFVGSNGSGKSTLLEAIARKYGLAVWGGEKTHILHRNPYATRLNDFLLLKTERDAGSIRKGFLFRAENFFNYASDIDDMTMTDPGIINFYGGLSLHRQSHGEAFLSFLENRCSMAGLYLLDEPEAALSPSNQMSLLKSLWKIAGQKEAQFIISTHSPIILSCPGAQILSFDHVPIRPISYEETHSYRFYKEFMNNRSHYLQEMVKSGEDTGEGMPAGS